MTLEQALQMERAGTDPTGKIAESRSAVLILLERALDDRTGAAHSFDRRVPRG